MANLVVSDVSKEFAARSQPLVVLSGVSLQLSSGQSLAVVGPSGSGKSTFLHVIGTLLPRTSGSLRLNDVDPLGLPPKQLAAFRNRQLGFIFQDHYLLPQLSVLENVLLPALATGSTTATHQLRAVSLLERVGLSDRIQHRPAELSGGERQRAAVARALLLNPTLVLADEPTGNLDSKSAAGIVDLLTELTGDDEDSPMLIVVTHSQEVAGRMQRQAVMEDGKLKDP